MPRVVGLNKSGKPVGEIERYSGAGVPVGYLACDGSSYLVSNFPALFNVIGYGYGGSGINFNVPDLYSQPDVFTSPWYTSTATTTVAHGLTNLDQISGYEVQEWNVTSGIRQTIDRSSLVTGFDSTNINLDWTGLTPTVNLKYRVILLGNIPTRPVIAYV